MDDDGMGKGMGGGYDAHHPSSSACTGDIQNSGQGLGFDPYGRARMGGPIIGLSMPSLAHKKPARAY